MSSGSTKHKVSRLLGRAAAGFSLALGLVFAAHAQDVGQGADGGGSLPQKVLISARMGEPDLFGFSTVRLGPTIYDEIWREASSSALPAHNAELEAVVAQLRTMPVYARVRRANAWLNARVSYSSSGSITDHHWGNLTKALARGRGAHEDIAIAKLQLLAAAGVPRRDMYMVMVRDLSRMATDALLVVRDGDRTYVLDSQHDEFVDANQTGRYFPVLAFSSEGQWLFGRRAALVRRYASSY